MYVLSRFNLKRLKLDKIIKTTSSEARFWGSVMLRTRDYLILIYDEKLEKYVYPFAI